MGSGGHGGLGGSRIIKEVYGKNQRLISMSVGIAKPFEMKTIDEALKILKDQIL